MVIINPEYARVCKCFARRNIALCLQVIDDSSERRKQRRGLNNAEYSHSEGRERWTGVPWPQYRAGLPPDGLAGAEQKPAGAFPVDWGELGAEVGAVQSGA